MVLSPSPDGPAPEERGNWDTKWTRRLQRAGHVMIYVLIAGTATAAFLLAVSGAFGLAGLVAIWALTLAAATVHLAQIRYRPAEGLPAH
jgi:hemolysin III